MYHLDNTSGVPEMPQPNEPFSVSPRWFGESQVQGGISWPGADWFNIIQAELLNLLFRAGIQPDKNDFEQLYKAVTTIGDNGLRKDLLSEDDLKGSSLVTYGPVSVMSALSNLFVSAGGVLARPSYQPVQGKNAVLFSEGVYSRDGLPFQVPGQEVTINESTKCIVLNQQLEARESYPTGGEIVVAHCRKGSLIEVVGNLSTSSFGRRMGYGNPTFIPRLPAELQRIEESIPIYAVMNINGEISYKTDYDVSVKKATSGITYYVDCINGSDSTGDGSQEKPFQRIKFAIEKSPAARTIMIRGGREYTRDFTWNVSVVDRDLDFIGYDGTPVLSTVYPNPLWAAEPGYPGVYFFSAGLVLTVADYKKLDSYGHPQVLTQVNSLAECAAQPGTRYTTSGTTHIHLFDSRIPDSEARLILQMTNGRIQDSCKVYMENIEFGDSFRGFQAEIRDASKSGYLYAKNCIFGLTATANSYNILGVNSILQGCRGRFGMQDIANYHSDTLGLGKKPWFVEIECNFGYGGFDGLPNNNASTAHDGAVGVRIGGEYYGTFGRVVHDVHEGTVSANFGSYAHNSSRDDFIGGACFTAGQGSDATGRAKMYLYGCRHSGPNASITSDGLSEVWLFDTPIGKNAQFTKNNPYHFIY
ncbi:TPA: hypothetical protein ACUJXS_000267 [Klebsiella pneumoniae]